MDQEEQQSRSPEFGSLLRRHRIAAKLSQEALAERARISVNGISSLERGARSNPRRETLALLSGALQLSAEQRRQFEAAALLSAAGRRGSAVTVGPWSSPAIANLPFALTSFVGRDRELPEICALVRGHRMVTLTGAGGIGKTQTALHVASSLEEAGDGPACFVALAPVDNPLQVVSTIASALGIQETPNRPLLESLSAHLKNRTLLLVLDNCEHVIAEAAVAADVLLSACKGVRILATSREALRAAGEYAYRLPPLAFPSIEDRGDLLAQNAATFGAIALFSDRGSAVDQRFALTDHNAPVIADICRRLDGIPLAIELAAARVNQLPLKAMAEKLDDRFRMLTQGFRNAPLRQQTMGATIDWSYNLLSVREQRVFERLSIFAGGCTLEEATSVCGDDEATGGADVFDELASLIEKSLLTRDSDNSETRYILFESFREYAVAKLAERGEHDIVAYRHARTYYDLAQRSGADPFAPADALPRDRIEEELDNWRAALHWTLNHGGDLLLGQQLAAETFGVWRDRSVEGRAWITSAIRLVDERTPAGVIADLRFAEAFVAWQLWESETQLSASQAAIAYYRSVGNSLGVARSQDLAGNALAKLGRIPEAKTAILEGIERAREVGDLPLVGFMLRGMAYACQRENDFVAAREYLSKALSIYRALPDAGDTNAYRIAWTISDRATIEGADGNIETALRQINDLLDQPRIPSLWRVVSNVLHVAASLLTRLGRFEEAEKYAREALELDRRHQLQPGTAWLLQFFAQMATFRPYANAESMLCGHARAVKIIGFVDAELSSSGSFRTPGMVVDRECILEVLRASLDPEVLAAYLAEGAGMDEDRAVELALQTVT